jgi:glycerol-1-phosphate dehydrogenase [NAD(P)+]
LINLEEFKIRDFLKTKFTCNCGKEHRVDIDNILIEKEAIAFLPSLINQYNFKKIFIIADANTYKVAGEITETALQGNGFDLKKYIFEDEEHLIPDEKAIGKLLIQITSDIDLILAIGSGTLNDLSRYLSYKLSIPYFIVVTAPSMDGYASTVSALIVNDLKTTYTAISPKAIIADINIIKNAPMEMITAGLGDILGKYTSLCDWELGRIINGEYYCETVVNIIRSSIQKCVSNIDGIKNRDNFAIKNLMEGLVLTGIAMSFVGNSRPAAGSEHHLSHFWEMMFLLKGKKAILHGTKVGIATLIITKLYELLVTKTVNFNNAVDKVNSFNQKEWVKCIEKTYKTAAPDIIALEERVQKNSIEKYNKRIQIIKSKWNDIIRTIKKIVPSAKEIEAILLKVDAPINPLQVGVDSNTILNSIIFAKEIRNRYTVLQLLWDLGLLREFASNINDYFIKEQGYKCLSDKNKAKGRKIGGVRSGLVI